MLKYIAQFTNVLIEFESWKNHILKAKAQYAIITKYSTIIVFLDTFQVLSKTADNF